MCSTMTNLHAVNYGELKDTNLLLEGKNKKEIGPQLNVSTRTVEYNTPHFLRKLYPFLFALVIIVLTTVLSACQNRQGSLLLPNSPKNAAINEIMTQEREGWHIEANSVQTFTTQEVGDWVLVGVRLNAQIQNDASDPIQRVGCIFVEKATKKPIWWEASDVGATCTVLDP